MRLKISLLSSIIGVMAVITYVQAVPIEVIYTGDGCDCTKKSNYLVNMPITPAITYNKPNEYGYNIERPQNPKTRLTYTFDFAVEEPKRSTPPPEVKWDLLAKIDRVTAHKKDCRATEEDLKPCGCKKYATAKRYIFPENSDERFTRNLKYSHSIDNMAQSSSPDSKVVAIIFQSLEQAKRSVDKSRNKRDISRIFMRPRRNGKRSDRWVKKYNKLLKHTQASEKHPRTNAKADKASSELRPMQQLRRFLTLPNFRDKRDIKGEYDLIEKDHKQMDLTLPEIIQYMPETLDPHFKRNRCNFAQSCCHPEQTDSTTNGNVPTEMTNSDTTTMMTTITSKHTAGDTLSITDAISLKKKKKENQLDNFITTIAHIKRNSNDYRNVAHSLAFKGNNPTSNSRLTYDVISERVGTTNSSHDLHPIPQYQQGSSYNSFSTGAINGGPSNTNATAEHISNAELDRVIAAIVNKYSNFIEASTHQGGALVDPPKVQELQAKYFLQRLAPWNNWRWLGGYRCQQWYPKIHAQLQN